MKHLPKRTFEYVDLPTVKKQSIALSLSITFCEGLFTQKNPRTPSKKIPKIGKNPKKIQKIRKKSKKSQKNPKNQQKSQKSQKIIKNKKIMKKKPKKKITYSSFFDQYMALFFNTFSQQNRNQ